MFNKWSVSAEYIETENCLTAVSPEKLDGGGNRDLCTHYGVLPHMVVEVGLMGSNLLRLPDTALVLILQQLDDARSLARAICAHRHLHLAAASDPWTWEPLVSRATWACGVHRKPGEGWPELCRRGHSLQARSCLVAVGGSIETSEPVDILWLGEVAGAGGEGTADGEEGLGDGNESGRGGANGEDGGGGSVASGRPRGNCGGGRFWRTVTWLDKNTEAPSAASDGHVLHVVGGYDGRRDQPLDSGFTCDIGELEDAGRTGTGGFRALPVLPSARCFAAAACDGDGRLWVGGGGTSIYRGARCLATIDVLDQGGEAWRAAGTLRRERCGHALANDARRADLWACGGYGGDEDYLAAVESFDMVTGRTTCQPNMKRVRSGLGASFGPDGSLCAPLPPTLAPPRAAQTAHAPLAHCPPARSPPARGTSRFPLSCPPPPPPHPTPTPLLCPRRFGNADVVGGSEDGSNALGDCERLDPREGVWHSLPGLSTPRGYLSAIFALDGERLWPRLAATTAAAMAIPRVSPRARVA